MRVDFPRPDSPVSETESERVSECERASEQAKARVRGGKQVRLEQARQSGAALTDDHDSKMSSLFSDYFVPLLSRVPG